VWKILPSRQQSLVAKLLSDKESVLSRKKQNSSTVAVQEVAEEDRYAIGRRKDERRYVSGLGVMMSWGLTSTYMSVTGMRALRGAQATLGYRDVIG
jgi:hypothetical protein